MTVLVTGGAGYIGSHMAWALTDQREHVVVLDSLVRGNQWLVPPDAVFVQGDAGDTDLVTQLIRDYNITDIIHFAGYIIVPESVRDPMLYYAGNTDVSRRLIDTAARAGVERFIFSSTASVYGMAGTGLLSETLPTVPTNPYASSKLMTEMMLADISQATGLRYGVLRYFNVAGADPQGRTGHCAHEATHLIKVCCQAALGLRPGVDIFGTDYATPDGTCLRDYIHVSDLVEAHRLLLHDLRDGGENGVMNCGYGRGLSVREVIAAVKDVSGTDFLVRETARRAGDPISLIADTSRLTARLGWTPKHDDLSGIVRSALDWDRHLASNAQKRA
ncbi:MAG: UDP-glucose 4-epimerase GalE [Pseudomonadota bacterium]